MRQTMELKKPFKSIRNTMHINLRKCQCVKCQCGRCQCINNKWHISKCQLVCKTNKIVRCQIVKCFMSL